MCDFLARIKLFKQIASDELNNLLDREENTLTRHGISSRSERQLYEKIFINVINEALEQEYEQLKVPADIFAEAVKTYNQMQAHRQELKDEARKRRDMLHKTSEASAEISTEQGYVITWLQSLVTTKNYWIVFALTFNLILVAICLKFGTGYLQHMLNW